MKEGKGSRFEIRPRFFSRRFLLYKLDRQNSIFRRVRLELRPKPEAALPTVGAEMQRAVAAAAAAASLALLCAASLSGGARGGATALYERQLDMEIHDRSCPASHLGPGGLRFDSQLFANAIRGPSGHPPARPPPSLRAGPSTGATQNKWSPNARGCGTSWVALGETGLCRRLPRREGGPYFAGNPASLTVETRALESVDSAEGGSRRVMYMRQGGACSLFASTPYDFLLTIKVRGSTIGTVLTMFLGPSQQ